MMADDVVMINRAPVLTLWAAVVTSRLGFEWEEAMTLGKAMAGLSAQSKGRAIGIFKPAEYKDGKPPKKRGLGEDFWIQVCGRPVPAKETEEGVRAVVKDKPIEPASVAKYLEGKFGEDLDAVREAMTELAAAFEPEALEEAAYALYEQFRPQIARGKRGWGQKGELSLATIRSLAEEA